MNRNSPSPSSWTIVGLYLFGVALFFWPLADLLTNTMPPHPGSLQWRYGFGGLMAAYLNTPTLGLVLLTLVAFWLRHTKTLRLISVLELLFALGLIVVLVTFALDLIQVRAARPESARPAVLAGGIIALLKHGAGATVLSLLGIGGWRTATRLARRASQDDPGEAGVVSRRSAHPAGASMR